MNYPIKLSFELLAIASQIYVRDANGPLIGYVNQKLLKLKADINVFADEQQTQQLYKIKADRIIDFSAKYNFTDSQGRGLGSIRRKGMRSIFKAHYMIFDENENQTIEIHEENGSVKVVDALLGEVPILGMFTGYFFNPSYIVTRTDGTQVARLKKQPAFMEGIFEFEPLMQIPALEEAKVLLSDLTTALPERNRG